jgi:hypothetical protein
MSYFKKRMLQGLMKRVFTLFFVICPFYAVFKQKFLL